MADVFKEVLQIVIEQLGAEEAQKLSTVLRGVGDSGAAADAKLSPLIDQLSDLAVQSAKVSSAIDIAKKITANNIALTEAKNALAALNAEFNRADKSSADVSVAFEQAEKRVKTLATEQLKLQAAAAGSAASLKASGIDATNLAAAEDQLRAKTTQVAQQINNTAGATKNLGVESGKTGGVLGEMRDHLLAIVSVATAVGIALKGVQLGKEALAEAANVEQSLSRVKAIAQSTADDFSALGEQIERSAIAANVSSAQSAATAAALAEQGQSASEIFQTLTPTLLLARDANMDFAQSAGVVDDILDLFGKSAGDAAEVVDKLVTASKGSKDGIGGMAAAIRGLAPDARQLGLDFDQLVGLLGLMTQNGIDAGKATRGLRTIFQDLQDPTSKFSVALGQLGDTSGDFGSAIETIRTSGESGQEALLGLDGAARSLILFFLQQAPGAIDAFTAALQRSQGAASETRKAIDDNLSGAFEAFTNSLDRLGSKLAKSSLTPLRDELKKLADQLTAFAESPAFERLQKALGDLFAEGVEAFDNFIQNVDWAGFVSSAQTALRDASKSIGEFKDDLSTVAAAINTVGASIGVVFRSVAVVFDLTKTAVSGLVTGLAAGMLAQSRAVDALTGKTSQLTLSLEAVRDSAKDAAENGVAALREDSEKLVDNLGALGGAADETGKSVETLRDGVASMQAGVATSTPVVAKAGSDFNVLSKGVENVANALGILPELFNADATAAKAAAEAHTEHANEIVRARKAVDDAQAALTRLTQSGEKSSVAFQQASNTLQAAQAELDRLTGKSDTAADSQRRLAQAFADLRIKSQDELQKTRDTAERSLEAIRQAFTTGDAKIEDVKRAYAAWAAAVRAAAADSTDAVKKQAEETIASRAAALGLADAVTQAGDAGKDAGDKTATAFDGAKQSDRKSVV